MLEANDTVHISRGSAHLRSLRSRWIFYATNYLIDDTDIEVDTYASPDYPQYCPTNVDVWTAFNGNYQSGSAIYPAVFSTFQSAYDSNGQEDEWDIGYTIYGQNPYTGSCGVLTNVSFAIYVGIATTFAQTVGDDGVGNCTSVPDCYLGGTPLCPQTNPQRWIVAEVGGGVCHPFHYTFWLTTRVGTGGKYCSSYSLAEGAASPPMLFPPGGPCTYQ